MVLSNPKEKELNIQLGLVEAVRNLSARVQHLETLETLTDFVALDKAELLIDTALVTFASIPQTYAALKVVAEVRTDRVNTADAVAITFNNDVGNNYDFIRAGISHNSVLGTTEGIAQAALKLGNVSGDSTPSNVFSLFEFIIPGYAGSSNDKTLGGNGTWKFGITTGDIRITSFSGFWRSTAAITEIDLAPNVGTNFMAGSKFYLYGLKASV